MAVEETVMPPAPRPPTERFWEKVLIGNQCWVWTGALQPNGYGRFDNVLAHRYSYRDQVAPIPEGMCVCHRCDNPKCVRPTHLFLGSHADNTHDASVKGRLATGDRHGLRLHPERRARGDQHGSRRHPDRLARGENHGGSKLTAAQVLAIRVDYASSGRSQKDIAEQYGIGPNAIHNIVRGKRWRHL